MCDGVVRARKAIYKECSLLELQHNFSETFRFVSSSSVHLQPLRKLTALFSRGRNVLLRIKCKEMKRNFPFFPVCPRPKHLVDGVLVLMICTIVEQLYVVAMGDFSINLLSIPFHPRNGMRAEFEFALLEPADWVPSPKCPFQVRLRSTACLPRPTKPSTQ